MMVAVAAQIRFRPSFEDYLILGFFLKVQYGVHFQKAKRCGFPLLPDLNYEPFAFS